MPSPAQAYNSRVVTSWLADECQRASASEPNNARLALTAACLHHLHSWYGQLESTGRYLTQAVPSSCILQIFVYGSCNVYGSVSENPVLLKPPYRKRTICWHLRWGICSYTSCWPKMPRGRKSRWPMFINAVWISILCIHFPYTLYRMLLEASLATATKTSRLPSPRHLHVRVQAECEV